MKPNELIMCKKEEYCCLPKHEGKCYQYCSNLLVCGRCYCSKEKGHDGPCGHDDSFRKRLAEIPYPFATITTD